MKHRELMILRAMRRLLDDGYMGVTVERIWREDRGGALSEYHVRKALGALIDMGEVEVWTDHPYINRRPKRYRLKGQKPEPRRGTPDQ